MKQNGKNPCKTRPGQRRTMAYQTHYSSAEAAAFANVPKASVYRAMREKHLPADHGVPGYPRIRHADLIAWMERREFPVPQPKRGTAPKALAIPSSPSKAHQQSEGVFEYLEPIPDVTLERADHMDVPCALLGVSGICLSYNADEEGWLANTDDAIEEAEVSLAITTVEMRALAASLLKLADELEAPAPVAPQAAPLVSPVEAASPQLLELPEVELRYGLSPHLLRKEIKAGRLSAYRIGTRYRLSMADIARWLENQKV